MSASDVRSLLLVGILAATSAHAEGLPPVLEAALPKASDAEAAIEAATEVRRAQGERDALRARASGHRRGSHEWVAGGQWLDRDAGIEGRFNEWEASVQRELRLPGKAAVDRRIADAEEAVGNDVLADGRHVAAIGLLEAWFEWRAAEELRIIADQAVADAEADLEATTTRLRSGDAARVDEDAALGALATWRRELRLAEARVQDARITLQARYPALPLPESVEPLRDPAMPTLGGRYWGDRVIAVSHELTLAQGRAEIEAGRAERARLDRRGNPTVGLRALSERGGDETAMGVFVTIPLGEGSRRAVAEETAALARAAEAEADAARIEVGRHARSLAARAEALVATWQLAKQAADAHQQEVQRLEAGRRLGGVALAPLLAARARQREAVVAEINARVAAHGSVARLLLDAHVFWINDDGHATDCEDVGQEPYPSVRTHCR